MRDQVARDDADLRADEPEPEPLREAQVALELLRDVGPMAVSSANKSGFPPAGTAQEAWDQLGEEVGVYLDGGPAAENIASTIVDLTGPDPVVLREGAVPVGEVSKALGVEVEVAR